jgi:hypothetical protein
LTEPLLAASVGDKSVHSVRHIKSDIYAFCSDQGLDLIKLQPRLQQDSLKLDTNHTYTFNATSSFR